ncbi:MAG TPA: hypothetical protein PLL69_03065, partial [Gemmatimonadales bacterium]|nr:hypothetical protein [Gemmatimonadales bacterium]
VLFTGDRDFVPLLRKLHTLGARTLLPVWEIAYTDHFGTARYIRTSPWLIREASHVHRIMEAIDAAPIGRDPLVDSLFLGGRTGHARQAAREAATQAALAAAHSTPEPAPTAQARPAVAAPLSSRPAPAPYAAAPRDVAVPEDGDLVLGKVTGLKNQFGFV